MSRGRRRRLNPLDYSRTRSMQLVLALGFLFLYSPIVSLVAKVWQGTVYGFQIVAL